MGDICILLDHNSIQWGRYLEEKLSCNGQMEITRFELEHLNHDDSLRKSVVNDFWASVVIIVSQMFYSSHLNRDSGNSEFDLSALVPNEVAGKKTLLVTFDVQMYEIQPYLSDAVWPHIHKYPICNLDKDQLNNVSKSLLLDVGDLVTRNSIQFYLSPKTIQIDVKDDTLMWVILEGEEDLDDNKSLKVRLEDSRKTSHVYDLEKLRPMVYSFNIPANNWCTMDAVKAKLLVDDKCVGVKILTFTSALTQIEQVTQPGINLLAALLDFVITQPNIVMTDVDAAMNVAFNSEEMKQTSDATFAHYMYDGDAMDQKRQNEFVHPTLLHLVSSYGLQEVSSSLLDCPGASLASTVRNMSGHTAAQMAKASGHSEIAQVIEGNTESDIYAIMVSYSRKTAEGVPVENTELIGHLPYDIVTSTNNNMERSLDDDNYFIMTAMQPQGQGPNIQKPADTANLPIYDEADDFRIPTKAQIPSSDASAKWEERKRFAAAEQSSVDDEETYESVIMPKPQEVGRKQSEDSSGQEDLIQILKQAKHKEITIDQAQVLYRDWELRNKSNRRQSFKSKRAELKNKKEQASKLKSFFGNLLKPLRSDVSKISSPSLLSNSTVYEKATIPVGLGKPTCRLPSVSEEDGVPMRKAAGSVDDSGVPEHAEESAGEGLHKSRPKSGRLSFIQHIRDENTKTYTLPPAVPPREKTLSRFDTLDLQSPENSVPEDMASLSPAAPIIPPREPRGPGLGKPLPLGKKDPVTPPGPSQPSPARRTKMRSMSDWDQGDNGIGDMEAPDDKEQWPEDEAPPPPESPGRKRISRCDAVEEDPYLTSNTCHDIAAMPDMEHRNTDAESPGKPVVAPRPKPRLRTRSSGDMLSEQAPQQAPNPMMAELKSRLFKEEGQ